MKTRVPVLACLLVACASDPPPPAAQPVQIAPAPAPGAPMQAAPSPQGGAAPQATLSGTMGGAAFVARSAFLVRPNRPFRKCSSALTGTGECSTDRDGFDVTQSTIKIYERAATCAEASQMIPRGNDRVVEIELQARWPVPPGSSYRTDVPDPRQDAITASFRQSFSSAAIAKGTAQFVHATPADGAVSLDLTTSNPNLPESGSVRGVAPFTVCP
ncbi:MAG: hypothetical protein KIT84_01880 [Labilithrix sp.]|nr:hypothetical protein [Labilithrix sp.]MCW5809737.1 hypothetical protein [Labilithrix sp.]